MITQGKNPLRDVNLTLILESRWINNTFERAKLCEGVYYTTLFSKLYMKHYFKMQTTKGIIAFSIMSCLVTSSAN